MLVASLGRAGGAAVHGNGIGVTLVVELGVEDGASTRAKLSLLTAKVRIVVLWLVNLQASRLPALVEALGSPVALELIVVTLVSGDAKLALQLWVVLEVAPGLLVSDNWSAVWVSALVLTSALVVHLGSGECIWGWLEVIVEHIKVRIPIDVASGVVVREFIAALLHLLLQALLVGLPYLGVDRTGSLKGVHGVGWILKLVHHAIVHAHVGLLLLIESISLLEVGLLVKILSAGISSKLVPALSDRLPLVLSLLLLVLGGGLLLALSASWLLRLLSGLLLCDLLGRLVLIIIVVFIRVGAGVRARL